MTQQPSTPDVSLRFSMGAILVVTALVAAVIACCSGIVRYGERRNARLARLDELNDLTKAAIVADVETIVAELGLAPAHQVELEQLLGRQMPVLVHEYGESPIDYRKTGSHSFMLGYSFWDPWYYDSTSPQAGWMCAD